MTSFRSDPRDAGGLCPDDARLIERLGGNDETEARLAWTVLRARTDDRLVRVAHYFLRSPADALALVADVYADLWERRRGLTIRKSLGGYLDQLVANRARTLLRTSNRRWRREASWATETENDVGVIRSTRTSDAGREPEVLDQLEAADLRAQIWDLMRGLPGRQREVCYLRLFEQLEFATIAVRLGIAEKTARSHWGLVMQRLMQELPLLRSAPGTSDNAPPEPERPGGARVLPSSSVP